MKEMMKAIDETGGVDWDTDIPLYLRHGIYIKKTTFLKTAVDRKTNEEVQVKRSALVARALKLDMQAEMGTKEHGYPDLLLRKLWPNVKSASDGDATNVSSSTDVKMTMLLANDTEFPYEDVAFLLGGANENN